MSDVYLSYNLRFKGTIHGCQEKRIITLSEKMAGPNKLLIQTNAGSTKFEINAGGV